MRTITKIICALLFSSLPLCAQQYGWAVTAKPSPTYGLASVTFIDSLHGWTGGGAIYKTSDGGVTWTSFGVAMIPRAISMADSLRGWAVGSDGSAGKIYKTTDGGASWFNQLDIYGDSYQGTTTLSLQKNITAGNRDSGITTQTTDGGTTWSERPYPLSDSIGKLTKVEFVDSLHGWILGGQRILKTRDGGSSWQILISPASVAISFIDTSKGWLADVFGQVYQTTNGGESWQKPIWVEEPSDFRSAALSFVDSLNGWVFGDMFYEGDISGAIFRTYDGGVSWHLDLVTHQSRYLNDGQMLDMAHGWAVGDAGNVFSYKLITNVVERLPDYPRSFSLRQNYPNPFNGQTTIEYEIKQSSRVTLTVFDVSGRLVEQILNARQDAGVYRLHFNGSSLASGVYYYTLKAGAFSDTKSMTIIK